MQTNLLLYRSQNNTGNEVRKIEKRLESEIMKLINQVITHFIAGGALGFGTLAALSVLNLKKEFPHIKLILALPCKNQTNRWSEKDIEIYGHIRNQADKTVYISDDYFRGCMQKRNRYLVDNSDVCVCYLTKDNGGTAFTVNCARKKALPIINIAKEEINDNLTPETLRKIVREILDEETAKYYKFMDTALVNKCVDFLLAMKGNNQRLTKEEVKVRVRQIFKQDS